MFIINIVLAAFCRRFKTVQIRKTKKIAGALRLLIPEKSMKMIIGPGGDFIFPRNRD